MKQFKNQNNQSALIQKSVILFITLLGFHLTSEAQEQEENNKTLSPYFLVLSETSEIDQLPLQCTEARVNITGMIADVTINQVYKNEGSTALEAIYTFLASSNAAVYAMEMTIGDRKIVARIEEKDKARQKYNQAKAEGKRTSLLEQQRPNVFQMNVANIMPGDEIQVSMKYTEMLVPEKGIYSFVYPTVVGPRYSEKPSANDQYVETPYQKEGESPAYQFDIDVHIAAGMPIQNVNCKSHEVNIRYPQSSQAKIQLAPTEILGGNRDFILDFQLSGNQIESGLMLYEHDDENFFLLMVEPPKTIAVDEIPPREYIFIVDVSGSMRGFPISVTKKLIRNLVVNLKPTDVFNIMVFAGTSGWMSEESVPANLSNINKAVEFIDNQRGGGSTNLLSALNKAMTFPRKFDNLSRSFVIVTDGYISVEKEVFDLISKHRDEANVFAFGIGTSVNRHLIEGIAHAGMGEPLIVFNEKEANKEAEKFREYISNPVLTQVKKKFSGFEAYDVEPVTVPDVLGERPVIIYGKYKGEAKGSITIEGHSGKRKYKKIFRVNEVKSDARNSAIRYLWARKRIQQLDDYQKLSYNNENVREVTELGLKYNLMTAYTSFLAIEEDYIANEGALQSVKQALSLPQGVSNSAIGFEMELDEIEFDFAFYKDVNINSEFNKSDEKVIMRHIELDLMSELNSCFGAYSCLLDNIKVNIDENGTITSVKIEGKNVTKELRQCLNETIRNWQFSKYHKGKAWQIEISF